MPDWMMKNLEIEEKRRVVLENAFVPKGRHMKLQPHTTAFVLLPDPKEILEQNLRFFSCLSVGDTFMIRHEEKEYYIDVVEVRPGDAICLTNTDCEVDFATPLDYKEPEKKKGSQEEGSNGCGGGEGIQVVYRKVKAVGRGGGWIMFRSE